MAGLSNPPGFGLNHYQDTYWARRASLVGPQFQVSDANGWRPTVSATDLRTVLVAAGSAECCGVYDETAATEAVAFAANTGGTDRYDYLVARYDWEAKTRTFAALTGTTSAPAINAGTVADAAKVNRIPGVRYEALIALVRVSPGAGVFAPAAIVTDLRVWNAEGMLATDGFAQRNVLDIPAGASLYFRTGADVGGSTNGRVLQRTGTSAWRQTAPPIIGRFGAILWAGGSQNFTWTGTKEMVNVTVPDPGVPYRARITTTFEGGAAAGSRYDYAGGWGGVGDVSPTNVLLRIATAGEESQRWRNYSSVETEPLTGQQTFRLVAIPIFGTGTGTLTTFNRMFYVTYNAA